MKIADSQFSASELITAPLKELIKNWFVLSPQMFDLPRCTHLERRRTSKQLAVDIRGQLTSQLQCAVDLNSEPGASLWLLALPIQEQGFHLNKQEFWDALHMEFTEYSESLCLRGFFYQEFILLLLPSTMQWFA